MSYGSGPYPANKTCVWVIEGPVGSQIQIQVLDDLNMKMHVVLNVKQWLIQDLLKGWAIRPGLVATLGPQWGPRGQNTARYEVSETNF